MLLQIDHIKAALKCAARKDVRYYLNGICVEVLPARIIYIGTDGHALFACSHASENAEADCGTFILNDAELKPYLKHETLTLSKDGQHLTGEATGKRGETMPVRLKPVDARFPDWRRVVPRMEEMSGQPGQFNPQLLAAVDAAFEMLGSNFGYHLTHNGPEHSALALNPAFDALGVIMPMRCDRPTGLPEFMAAHPARSEAV